MPSRTPHESTVVADGESWHRIHDFDRMPPFLISLPSASDLWMFVSSGGGLTAGRVDADGALFPYETVDKLHDAHHHTGPVSVLRVQRPDGTEVRWEPFLAERDAEGVVERHLDKSHAGDRLAFEEVHHGLGLALRARWAASERFGWVRTVTLENRGRTAVRLEVMDGLRHLLPSGVPLGLYQGSSSLVDAYRQSDADAATGLAVHALTSRILDRPEAAEELHANVSWSVGLTGSGVHLSAGALAAFRRGERTAPTARLNGQRGHHLVHATLELAPGARACWHVVADVALGHAAIEALRTRLADPAATQAELEADLTASRDALQRIVAAADGLQVTGDAAASVHHRANTLYNAMRGGVFADQHLVPSADFAAVVRLRCAPVAERAAAFLAALPASLPVDDLVARARATGDADLHRLALEYLPLYFGRRHGDPSRPWNRFSIRVRNADGGRALRYEGNWRDIFQNWEALALGFPDFVPGMIARFVGASTADGFNPYRISREGLDWEVPDPAEPWSHIGYWGDHQIVYLLKLLELLDQRAPGALEGLLGRSVFSYADVPYRLKPYASIVDDPHETIVYDTAHAAVIAARVEGMGSDGRLVPSRDGGVQHANLYEKLLVPALSKLSNLVPDGGIWMNTQRPEWNDANNALVGYGVSMVTLAYLRRYLAFLDTRLGQASAQAESFPVAAEVAEWFRAVHGVLRDRASRLTTAEVSPAERREVMDALGLAFQSYRDRVHGRGFTGARVELPLDEARALCRDAIAHLDHALAVNRRADGLWHSYNLLARQPNGRGMAIRHLDEMLEGQVAVLSSGAVSPGEAVGVLDALFGSALYREDQRSFMLYPDRRLPDFLDRNVVPDDQVRAVPLFAQAIAAGDDRVVTRDAGGRVRFHASFRNVRDLDAVLDRMALDPAWSATVARDRQAARAAFESVFQHHAFTGRSGRMYGYEGLGSIYWHMVAKLLLAVQEIAFRAADEGAPESVQRALANHYRRVRAGLGFEKTAAEYGAFPFDPYSHTPRHAGAQQPGMTGQVKEEILTRLGELGVRFREGSLRFDGTLLRAVERLAEPTVLPVLGFDGRWASIEVPAGGYAFTLAQVPVCVCEGATPTIVVHTADGARHEVAGSTLDAAMTRRWFSRCGDVVRVEVRLPAEAFARD
ncbi:MAG: hypothetical protein RL721_1456 [Candidatus Eisenbacteria bacterium]